MKKISITDATLLAASHTQGLELSYKDKVDIAKTLDRLCVDTICLAPIVSEKADTLLTRTVAAAVRNSTLSMPVGYTTESADIAWNAVCKAEHPQLFVDLPVSTVQMEYICHKKADKMLAYISDMISHCRALCDKVEFAAGDATRAEFDFLCSAIETAINAGATGITVCDTAGTMMPDEFIEFVNDIQAHVPSIDNVSFGVQCDDTLHIAAACAVSAARMAANSITVTITGGIAPTLVAVSGLLKNRGDYLGIYTSLRTTELNHSIGKMKFFSDAVSSDDTVISVSGAVTFDRNDTLEDITQAIRKLGYELSDEDCALVYESFCAIARRKVVDEVELERIIGDVANQVPPTYKLLSFVSNSGSNINATSCIELEKNGEILRGVCLGDGAIDSAFMAIEQIIGCHYELDDFRVNAVTQGREAIGEALVKLRSDGRLYSGSGISTDIIEASVRAYVSALNKIAYEEMEK